MTEVLERLGFEVDFPQAQTCCGQPAFNSGYSNEARRVAEHFLKVFDAAEYIVVPSGSCTTMIKNHYTELGLNHATDRVWELSRFILEVAKVDDVGARFDGIVTYHDSCHALRELRIKEEPRRLLANVRGLELREMEAAEECCGFGGTFSVKFPEISGAMARTKIESIRKTQADAVVSIDSSCLMQIDGAIRRAGLSIRTLHLAEVLASR